MGKFQERRLTDVGKSVSNKDKEINTWAKYNGRMLSLTLIRQSQ